MKKIIVGATLVMLTAVTAFAGGDKKAKTKIKGTKACCTQSCDPKNCTVDGKKCDPKDCKKSCDYSKCSKEMKKGN